MSWRQFIFTSVAGAVLLGLVILGFILILDPYQNVPFSPALNRAPISQNQRYSYPALARSSKFDSAVIGTSTVRLLDPKNFDTGLGSHFVNLAMNSATAYEQLQMLRLFMRNHLDARFVVLGIDASWCQPSTSYERYTIRDFPQWMYDDNRWNDLAYLFNDKALENAVRMLELLRGKRNPKYGRNGFDDFTAKFGEYRYDEVASRLYQGAEAREGYSVGSLEPGLAHPEWQYSNLALLPTLLSQVPRAKLAIVFIPFHANYLRKVAAIYAECKGRVDAILKPYQTVLVLDYMRDTALTRNDRNYWDRLHTNREVADDLVRDVVAELRGEGRPSLNYRRWK